MILIKKLAGHATALVPLAILDKMMRAASQPYQLGVVAEYVLANTRARALERRNDGHH